MDLQMMRSAETQDKVLRKIIELEPEDDDFKSPAKETKGSTACWRTAPASATWRRIPFRLFKGHTEASPSPSWTPSSCRAWESPGTVLCNETHYASVVSPSFTSTVHLSGVHRLLCRRRTRRQPVLESHSTTASGSRTTAADSRWVRCGWWSI